MEGTLNQTCTPQTATTINIATSFNYTGSIPFSSPPAPFVSTYNSGGNFYYRAIVLIPYQGALPTVSINVATQIDPTSGLYTVYINYDLPEITPGTAVLYSVNYVDFTVPSVTYNEIVTILNDEDPETSRGTETIVSNR